MTNDALRRKLRPLIAAIVEPLVTEAIAKAESIVRAHFEALLAPANVAHRDPKPAKRKVKRRAVVPATRAQKQPTPAKAKVAIVAPAPKQTPPVPSGTRSCGCGLRGPHRKGCSGETAPPPVARTPRVHPTAPPVARERTPAQQRRDEILARTAASRAALG